MLKKFFLLSTLCLKIYSQDLYVQELIDTNEDLNRIRKVVTLNEVIEQGMRKNFGENIRKNNEYIIQNNIEDNKESFYLPKLSLTLDATTQRIGSLNRQEDTSGLRSKIPTGSFGLEMGDYSIFNWGKDYLAYQNEKEDLEREKEQLKEKSREFRQNLIILFTKNIYLQEVVRIKKEQLRNSSFVYRLNREKVTQSKTTKHDYYQSRSEYLRAQQEYFEAKLSAQQANESLAEAIDDSPGTMYIIEQVARHEKVKLTLDGSIQLAKKNAPFIKDAFVKENIATREYEIALKDNMALPKISVDLGTYKHRFSQSDSSTNFQNSAGARNLEVVAVVSAKWNIFGDGGVFNRRKLANSRLEKENSTWDHRSAKRNVELLIANIFQDFSNSHDLIKILEARVPSQKKTMELSLNNYIDGKGKYTDFHLSLMEYDQAQIRLEELKWNYLRNKILLAQIIGLEELPGESFDTLMKAKEGDK